MKNQLFIIFLLLIFSLSCEKNKDCGNNDAACTETPPTDEICTASFLRWFYNEESNSCEQIGYSGCEAYGFETKDECEDCLCQ